MTNLKFSHFIIFIIIITISLQLKSCLSQDSSNKQTVYCLFNYDIECNSTCSMYGFEVGHCSKGRCICHGDLLSKQDQLLILSGTSIITSTVENLKNVTNLKLNRSQSDKKSNIAHLHNQLQNLEINPKDIVNDTAGVTDERHIEKEYKIDESFRHVLKTFVTLVERLRQLIEIVVRFFSNATDVDLIRHSDRQQLATFDNNSTEGNGSKNFKDFLFSTRDFYDSRTFSPLSKESVEDQGKSGSRGGGGGGGGGDVAGVSDEHVGVDSNAGVAGARGGKVANNGSGAGGGGARGGSVAGGGVSVVAGASGEELTGGTGGASGGNVAGGGGGSSGGSVAGGGVSVVTGASGEDVAGGTGGGGVGASDGSLSRGGGRVAASASSMANVSAKGVASAIYNKSPSTRLPPPPPTRIIKMNATSYEVNISRQIQKHEKVTLMPVNYSNDGVVITETISGTKENVSAVPLYDGLLRKSPVEEIASALSDDKRDKILSELLENNSKLFEDRDLNVNISESPVVEPSSEDWESESLITDSSEIPDGFTDPQLGITVPFMVSSTFGHHRDDIPESSVIPEYREINVSSSESPIVETSGEDQESENLSTDSSGIQGGFTGPQLGTTMPFKVSSTFGHHKGDIPESLLIPDSEKINVASSESLIVETSSEDQESESLSTESLRIQEGFTNPQFGTTVPFIESSTFEHFGHQKDNIPDSSVIPVYEELNMSSLESPVFSEDQDSNSSSSELSFVPDIVMESLTSENPDSEHESDLRNPEEHIYKTEPDFSISDSTTISTRIVLEDGVYQQQSGTSSPLSSLEVLDTESSIFESSIPDNSEHQQERPHSFFSTMSPHFNENQDPANFSTKISVFKDQQESDIRSWNSSKRPATEINHKHKIEILKSSISEDENNSSYSLDKFNISRNVNTSRFYPSSLEEEEIDFKTLGPFSVEDFESDENLKPDLSRVADVAKVADVAEVATVGTAATSHHLQKIITVLISNLNNGSISESYNQSSVHSGSSVSTLKYLIVLLTQRLKDLDDPSGSGDLKVDKDQGPMDDLTPKEIKDLIVLLQKRVEILEKKIQIKGTEHPQSLEEDYEDSSESYEDVTIDYDFYSDDGLLESVRSSVDVIIRNYIAKQKAAAAAKRNKNVTKTKRIKKPKHKHLHNAVTEIVN